jgi:hypothetical protein
MPASSGYPDHGSLHHRPTTNRLRATRHLATAGGWSGHRDRIALGLDRRGGRYTRNGAVLIGAIFLLLGALRMGWVAGAQIV